MIKLGLSNLTSNHRIWQKFESLTNRPLSYVWLQFQGGSIILKGSCALNLSASVLLTDPSAIYIKIHDLSSQGSVVMLTAESWTGVALRDKFSGEFVLMYALRRNRRSNQGYQWPDKKTSIF